jgi:toxin YoeB
MSTDAEIVDRISRLIEDARRSPLTDVGKPKPLRRNLAGWWSRRINTEHRLIYRVAGQGAADQRIEILSCRYHYADT